MNARVLLLALLVAAAGAVLAAPPRLSETAQQPPFPHDKHANVFPLCSTCHAGVTEPGQPLWPTPAQCAACHDGTVQPRVEWAPRVGPRAGNRRFDHDTHNRAVTTLDASDSTLRRTCGECHVEAGAQRMAVQHAVIGNCLECHGLPEPHVDNAPESCATCHVRISEATSYTREEIAAFPRPQSHDSPDFLLGGHGRLASTAGGTAVAASCATCHARNLCLQCHVNAPESRVIGSLALDARSPVLALGLPIPASHQESGFLRLHGREAVSSTATCAACHTRVSCATCHAGEIVPKAVASLPDPGPERAPGVHLTRTPPPSHTWHFREGHGPEANARPATCEACHTRSTCLECHRPEAAQAAGFHPRGFLARHPSAAYARAANCSDCHNAAQFCQACHQQAGVVAQARLGRAGFHDAFRGFSLGHGQAARQNLESCVACHTERDCAACHAAAGGGFGFNPHGPGFNARRMQSRSPSMCAACHGPPR